MSYVKKHAIRDMKSSTVAQDIDDNFDEIFKTLRALRRLLDNTPTTDGVIGANGAQGPPGDPGPPGEDATPVPGPRGSDGATGAVGPAGPVTIGPMGIDGVDGEDGMMIPGPQGPAGADGAAGSGGEWELIEERTMAGNTEEDFTDLGDYTSIMVLCRNITKSVSGTIQLRVSVDNGSTFLAGTSYTSITGAGVESGVALLNLHTTSTTSARSASFIIFGNVSTVPKVGLRSVTSDHVIFDTTSVIDAVRIFPSAGGTFPAGTIAVYGRP